MCSKGACVRKARRMTPVLVVAFSSIYKVVVGVG